MKLSVQFIRVKAWSAEILLVMVFPNQPKRAPRTTGMDFLILSARVTPPFSDVRSIALNSK